MNTPDHTIWKADLDDALMLDEMCQQRETVCFATRKNSLTSLDLHNLHDSKLLATLDTQCTVKKGGIWTVNDRVQEVERIQPGPPQCKHCTGACASTAQRRLEFSASQEDNYPTL